MQIKFIVPRWREYFKFIVIICRFNVFPCVIKTYISQCYVFISVFKGCVHCICASLFLSLNESTCQTRKNVLYFTSKALHSCENQILEFYVFEFHDVDKYLSIKQDTDFTE